MKTTAKAHGMRSVITTVGFLCGVAFLMAGCVTTRLHRAATLGDVMQMQTLLTGGANVNAKDQQGRTPLHLAAEKGHAEAVQLLIERGADVNCESKNGWTPLMVAAEKGYPPIARVLIAKGADVNARNAAGGTALFVAAYNGSKEIARLLVEQGGDVDSKCDTGWTPLMAAAKNGHTEIVQSLIAGGADVNCKCNTGWTPLMVAADNEREETALLLMETGAEVPEPHLVETNKYTVYATAKAYQLAGQHHERDGDMEKAIECYTVAADSFEEASDVFGRLSKEMGTRKTLAVVAFFLPIVDSRGIDWLGAAHQSKMSQVEYAERSKRSHESSLKCRAIIERLRETEPVQR